MRRLSHPSRYLSPSTLRSTTLSRSASSGKLFSSSSINSFLDFLPKETPFSFTFFSIAIFHAVIYSLLICEAPAQAFLVREQANLSEGATVCIQESQQLNLFQSILGAALLYTTLAYSQRTQEAEAQQTAKDSILLSQTQDTPPLLSSLAGSVSGTHFLGVFAFLPSVNQGSETAAAEAPAESNNY